MVADQHTEVERKYDVPPGARVPELTSVPEVDRVAPADEVELDATYFDTAGLALARAGITLRRRTGGADAGWHLKLPVSADIRSEVRRPLEEGHGGAPAELLEYVRAFVRDQEVAPVMSVRNRRVVHRLLDAEGRTLAELCDDHVTAQHPADGSPPGHWREWEVELVDGTDLLEPVETLLLNAGARPAGSSSKLARALGERLPGPTGRSRATRPGRNDATGVLLTEYLSEHVSRLKQEDLRLRAGDDEGVHQMRIAARRLRSALATYRDVLAPGSAEGLRAELKWLGGVLAPARDAQVLRERLGELVRHQPAELVLGPVPQRIDNELGASFRTGRSEAELALAGKRYFRLLDRLDTFTSAPPFSEAAQQPIRRGVPRLLQADLKRVRKRHRAVEEAPDQHAQDLAHHEVRKAAKRLRYAAETARPVFGKRAKRLGTRAKRIQQMLGEHQDTVVARDTLREIGVQAHLDGENGFTFGRLHALEQGRAAELEREYPSLLEHLPTRKLRSWLDH
ncbi:CYTH and CHAD domain-containing protein [Nocardioides gansuensis]|uniref:CYTH and CHAD domain-containing protein n=1 Tax=Nocardioides gansuensis TaxID=2138300 RepID=UPI001FE3B1F6|nr:CYTH and CHAD domain-containing protein [Nocardioides gansuensis]